MSDVDAWMNTAAGTGPAARDAIDRLAELGPAAVPALIQAIAGERTVPLWTAILVALRADDKLALLEPYLGHESPTVLVAVVEALGRSGDGRAVEPIARLLATAPLPAAAALGDLGDRSAVPALRAAIEPLVGDPPSLARLGGRDDLLARRSLRRQAWFVLTAGAALAKLGDMAIRPVAIEASRLASPDDPYLAGEVRREAIEALDVMVGPGVAGAIHAACTDPVADVADEACAAARCLGRVPEIEVLLRAIAAARDEERAGVAIAHLQAITGVRPPDGRGGPPSWHELERWCQREARRFQPGVCYRGGVPVTLDPIIGELTGRNAGLARFELRRRIGVPFLLDLLIGVPATASELAAIEAWRRQHADRFAAGQLHRWGTIHPPSAVD